MTKSLALSDYIAVVSDFDDTILNNTSSTPGQNLHERSRLDAIRLIGASQNIPGLTELPAEMNAVAFYNASVHSVEGAFWWLLVQQALVDADTVFDAHHPLIQQLVTAKDHSYQVLLETEAREVPGAREFFGKLYANGFANKLAIASTGQRADILKFLDAHGFADYFSPEHIFAKEDVQSPKPHPESFDKAIQSMGFSLDDAPKIIAFEDDPRGIQAAKALNMFTCAVTTRFSEADLLKLPVPPDFIAKDFNDYIQIFGL